MLVEDNLVIAPSLANSLKRAGYHVRVVATSREACAKVRRMRPELIILDLVLPDIDGLVLTMRLKTMTDAPVIICSARCGQIDRVLGLRLGAVDFLAKPCTVDDLKERIQPTLASRAPKRPWSGRPAAQVARRPQH